jgi:hypothetical protein
VNSRREFLLFMHERWAWIIIRVHCSCSGLYLFKKKTNPKIFKKIISKNCDFLKYFSTTFA